jgi:hypothetical protein
VSQLLNCYAECRNYLTVMLSVIMLSVIMLNVVMLSVVRQIVVMLNVVAPLERLSRDKHSSLL